MQGKAIRRTEKRIEIIKRRDTAIDLRMTGHSYREIADAMIELASRNLLVLPDTYDERYAYRDVMAVIDEANKNMVESAEALRTMELHNLNRMQAGIIERAANGDLKAIDRVIKIMSQREKYVPKLSEPQKIEIRTWQQEVIDLIKEGKITIENVRELPEELRREIMAKLPEPGSETGDGAGTDTVEGEFIDLGQVDEASSGEVHSERDG